MRPVISLEDPDYLLSAGILLVFISFVTCLCALTSNIYIENSIAELYSAIAQVRITLEIAQNAVSFPDLALDKFSGNDPDQDVESFLLTVDNKIDFSLGSPPKAADDAARYLFRKKALFSSLLRGPAAEWYEGFNTSNPLPTWIQVRTAFITRFSDVRDKYRLRIIDEICVRGKKGLVKNFYQRVKPAIDKGWPIAAAANQNERDAQQNLRNQKYIDFTIGRLTPSGHKRKAHEYLIEHPNTT